MENYLAIGVVLGVSAGFAPGPLLTLVITETLRHNVKSGIKVALAPVITDLPIIVISLLLLSRLVQFNGVLGIISIIGGLFVFYMSYENISSKGYVYEQFETTPKSVTKGVLANALSPHPYLFWFSVGAPTVVNAMSQNIYSALAFILGFYVFLVGSKILVAVLTGRSKEFLAGRAYINTMRFLGILLGVFALMLVYDGFVLIGANNAL